MGLRREVSGRQMPPGTLPKPLRQDLAEHYPIASAMRRRSPWKTHKKSGDAPRPAKGTGSRVGRVYVAARHLRAEIQPLYNFRDWQ